MFRGNSQLADQVGKLYVIPTCKLSQVDITLYNFVNLPISYYFILQVMSRLPEFMSQVDVLSSVILIILNLHVSLFPELLWHLALILLQVALKYIYKGPSRTMMTPRSNIYGPSLEAVRGMKSL